MDDDLRTLERRVRAGDFSSAHCLARAKLRSGDIAGAARAYDIALANAPNSEIYDFAEESLLGLGVPWVRFSETEMILYNVLHQGAGDTSRVPYKLVWDLSRFKHERANRRENDGECFFTQDRLVEILGQDSKKNVPTPKEYHSTVLFLDSALQRGFQPTDVARVQQLFKEDFEKYWMITSGRVEGPTVLQGYGRKPESQERIQTDIRGNTGFLRDIGDAGPIIAQTVLGAHETPEQLDALYNTASGSISGAYAWTRESTDTQPRAVVLGRNVIGRFDIGCSDSIYGRPARLVVASRAKKICSGNEGAQ